MSDFIGVDIGYDVRMQRYKETGDEADKPSKLIEKMVKNGELGRKSGKGFYSYSTIY